MKGVYKCVIVREEEKNGNLGCLQLVAIYKSFFKNLNGDIKTDNFVVWSLPIPEGNVYSSAAKCSIIITS